MCLRYLRQRFTKTRYLISILMPHVHDNVCFVLNNVTKLLFMKENVNIFHLSQFSVPIPLFLPLSLLYLTNAIPSPLLPFSLTL